MKAKAYLRVTAALFAVVAMGHAARAMLQLPVRAGGLDIPVWLSWLGMAGAGILSAWGFSAARKN